MNRALAETGPHPGLVTLGWRLCPTPGILGLCPPT